MLGDALLEKSADLDESLTKALEMMRAALELLDRANGPADVGAHLDLAVCRLEERLAAYQI
jgi:hypothetical protein